MGCYNSKVVKASPEKTWEVLSNFHDFSWCPDVVESVEKVGDEGSHQIGVRRILNGVFHETLVAIDNDAHILQYSIDDGPDAVSKDNVRGYIGEVRLFPVTDSDSTFVLWTSSWDSSGGGVEEFCNPIYQALLSGLKNHFA
jgi:hypothetical protein